MRDLLSVPAMRPPGSPRTGVPGRLHREAAGERPPRARPQRRGSPGPIPNPAVKPAFAESTAALGCGRAGRRARGGRFSTCAGRGPQGGCPLRPSSRLGGTPEGAFPRPGGSTDGGACVTSADRGAGARPEGRPCRAVLRSGAARLLGSALYALRVISPGASDGFLCAVGWSEAGFLSLCAASRFGFLLVTESAYVDYNLKAIYSSLAQCGCRGLCESLILARTFGACKV